MNRPTINRAIAVVFLTFGLIIHLPKPMAMAQDDQPTLDELLQLLPRQRSTIGRDEKTIDRQDASDVAAEVLEKLSEDQPADVFGQAVSEMDQVADRIGNESDVGVDTQRLQESILAKLDQVIAAAKKSGMGSGSGGGESSGDQSQQQDTGSEFNVGQGKDATESSSQGGAGGGGGGSSQSAASQEQQGTLEEYRQQWGKLPARLRDDLLQGINEKFSSVYRELTGQYYRRLAQEGQE